MPTPCKPPDVWYTLLLNLPPAWSVVKITSKADFFGYFGCLSIGIPLPLSETVILLSNSTLTSMNVANPATASSIELSITSANK